MKIIIPGVPPSINQRYTQHGKINGRLNARFDDAIRMCEKPSFVVKRLDLTIYPHFQNGDVDNRVKSFINAFERAGVKFDLEYIACRFGERVANGRTIAIFEADNS